ncbi:Ig-like domain repeat protein [Paracidobacterium acidisoli]|nr:Ig-like domain repeat protein [Paracidobacterium acidisoli]MBT9330988.1 Ig-like domain repeat protein [Paracidobacterium acidisoli]
MLLTRIRSLHIAAAATTVLVSLLTAPVFAQTAATPSLVASRITAPINENNLVPLKGNVHPQARAQFDRGAASGSLPTGQLVLVLSRSAQQQQALTQYLASLQDVNSPNYHKWLTPEQYGAQYGVSDADLDAVQSWLTSKGFQVGTVPASRNFMRFSGTFDQLQTAFHTSIRKYLVQGVMHFANASDPQIPAALAPVVAGVAKMNDFRPKSNAKLGGTGRYDSALKRIKPDLTLFDNQNNPYLYVDPADAATIYDTPNATLNPNYSGTTYDGTGVTIGIVGDSNVTMQDIINYRETFLGETSGSTNNPTVIVEGNDPGINGDEGEALLDNEIAGGIAPKATINFYTADNTDLQGGIILAALRAIGDNTVSILNLSFGECEAGEGTSENQLISEMWEEAAAQGISVTVSTGDSGSAGCDNDNTETQAQFGLNVNGLASTPFNIAVGGTDYDALIGNNGQAFSQYVNVSSSGSAPYYRTAKSYIPEEPWNNSTFPNTNVASNVPYLDPNTGNTNIVAAGGGQSSCVAQDQFGNCEAYSKPSFQTSLTPNDQVRDLPDVSLLAADGFYGALWAVCADNVADGDSSSTYTDCQTSGGQITDQTTFSGYGGTSAAAPAFAGMLALVEQKTGSRLGQADYVLYNLASSKYSTVFHDVTTGDNSVVCTGGTEADCNSAGFLTGYNAGTGYDYASGLGSVDAAQMVNNWSSVSLASTSTSFDINGSTAAVNVSHGTSLMFKVGVTPVSATGDVAIVDNADGSANGPVSSNNGNQTVLTLSGGAATTNYNGLPGGSYTVYANYAGDASHASSQSAGISVTISAESSATNLVVSAYDPVACASGSCGAISGTAFTYGQFISADAQIQGTSSDEQKNGTEGVATGSVAFLNGSTKLGTSNVTSDVSVASYTTPSNAFPAFPVGSYNLTAQYSGDASYHASTSNAVAFTVAKGSTSLSGSASSTSIQASSSTNVTVLISTDSEGAFPTGTITLTANGKTVGTATSFNNGFETNNTSAAEAIISVSGTSLNSGSNTITASYSGDANYAASSGGSVTVAVSGTTGSAGFGVTAAPPSLTINPGATTGNTSTIAVTPSNGFTGSVALACSVASPAGATDPATCSLSSSSANVTGATAANTTLTINTTASSTAHNSLPLKKFFTTAGGVALALVVFFGIPARRRGWQTMLGLLIVIVTLAGVGCGGGGGNSGGGGGGSMGTTAGTYTVTVTGTSGSLHSNTTVTVTVN